MTTKQKHTKLKNLARAAKDNLYAMVKLASEILEDHAYVDSLGGDHVVIDILEADEFAHFGGSPGVLQMVQAYRAHPDEQTWSKYRYNVWAMIDLANPVAEKASSERTNWKKLALELEDEVKKLSSEVDNLAEENAMLRGEIRVLRRERAA